MDPIITGELIESTLASRSFGQFLLAVLAVLAMVVLLMIALMSLTKKTSLKYDPAEEEYLVKERSRAARIGWALVALALAATCGILSITLFHGYATDPGHPGSDDRVIHAEAIPSAISEKYRLDQIAGAEAIQASGRDASEQGSGARLYSDEMTERIERLCSPVGPESYELVGVADGQEIRFRVGFADCANPDPEIIIVSAPNSAVTPADLERR